MKILIVLDASHFQLNQLAFPQYIASLGNGEITTLFLQNITTLKTDLSAAEPPITENTISQNISNYESACREAGLSGSFITSEGIPEEVTILHSRFADLLLISPLLSFRSDDTAIPTTLAEEILARAQCPVLVMPQRIREIGEVIHTYDGNYSSVYAIRQFARLFPALKNRRVTVLYVPQENEVEIPHQQELQEYLTNYYETVQLHSLPGKPSDVIPQYLSQHTSSIVTFGAYGRSQFSRLLKKSSVEDILSRLDLPVFVTHPA